MRVAEWGPQQPAWLSTHLNAFSAGLPAFGISGRRFPAPWSAGRGPSTLIHSRVNVLKRAEILSDRALVAAFAIANGR